MRGTRAKVLRQAATAFVKINPLQRWQTFKNFYRNLKRNWTKGVER